MGYYPMSFNMAITNYIISLHFGLTACRPCNWFYYGIFERLDSQSWSFIADLMDPESQH